MRIASLSYGSSIAYPHRTRSREVWNSEALTVVLSLVHIENLGVLPPDPRVIAWRGVQIGVAERKEFNRTVWF